MPFFVLSLDELAAETEPDVRTAGRAEVLYQLGTMLAQLYKLAQDAEVGADRHLRASLDLEADSGDTLVSLARLEERLGQTDDAARLYALAWEHGLDRWRSNVLYGDFVLQRLVNQPSKVEAWELERAREALRRAIELEPAYGKPYALLGATYLHAERDYEEGIKDVPSNQTTCPPRGRPIWILFRMILNVLKYSASPSSSQRGTFPRLSATRLWTYS